MNDDILLPGERELLEQGHTLEQLVVNYRVLFLTCWDLMTPEQQVQANTVLQTAGLISN